MGKINVSGFLDGLGDLLKSAEKLLPVAQAIGGPVVANVATTIIAGVGIIQNLLDRVEGVKGALSEKDEAKLRQMLAELQAINDKLAEAVSE